MSAEEAVKVVKSGDWMIAPSCQARLLVEALARRKDELQNVELHPSTPQEAAMAMFFFARVTYKDS